MKNNIHPQNNPVIFVDVSTGDEIVTTSTLTSDETRDIDGVSHYVISCDITSFSHPFYTGDERFVDELGRVEKFLKKMEKSKKNTNTRKKKNTTDSQEEHKSYKELLRNQRTELKQAEKAPAKEA